MGRNVTKQDGDAYILCNLPVNADFVFTNGKNKGSLEQHYIYFIIVRNILYLRER